ncbi:MAG: hypothetical protein R3C49_11880 [Planctomycetaceae bacterium]
MVVVVLSDLRSAMIPVDHVALRPMMPEQSAQSADSDRQLWVPVQPGDSLLIGSLDVSGGNHAVELLLSPVLQTGLNLVEADFEIRFRHDAEEQSTETDVRSNEAGPFGFVSQTAELSAADLASDPSAIDGVTSVNAADRPAPSDRRRFLMPRFCGPLACNHSMMATEMVCRDGISVYVVDEVLDQPDRFPPANVRQLAEQVGRRVDQVVLPLITQRLGEIDDLDMDQRLSLVIGLLAEAGTGSVFDHPITGCVRPEDFDPASVHCCDAVYLDCRLPVDDDLDAVLTHELAHAAVFSAVNRSQQAGGEFAAVPCWLNEAIAHLLERTANPDSANLQQRMEAFRRQPHRFPAVIPEGLANISLRRGPSRAAGCLFLSSLLNGLNGDALKRMVMDPSSDLERIEHMTGQPFSEGFRSWGLQLMMNDARSAAMPVVADIPVRIQLAGTAFLWTTTFSEPGVVNLMCRPDARLQLTIVRSDHGKLEGIPHDSVAVVSDGK